MFSLQWRHNGCDSVSNHQPHNCLLNHLFRRRSKKTPQLRITGLCAGNSPMTSEFPTQMASNAENVFIGWRHHEQKYRSSVVAEKSKGVLVQCFDFYSLLLAVGRTHVNYFSLDVEGPELDILETIPFDRVTIDIFTIEYRILPHGTMKKESLAKLQKLRNFFRNTGMYEEVGILPTMPCCGLDVIFKRVGI